MLNQFLHVIRTVLGILHHHIMPDAGANKNLLHFRQLSQFAHQVRGRGMGHAQ